MEIVVGVEVELELVDTSLVFGCWEVVFGEEDKNLRLQNSEFDALNSPFTMRLA